MRVAIIGAGVAGSLLAYLLSRKRIPTVVFEKKTSREKPCGGGCTAKVARAYPFLPGARLPSNLIYKIHYESRGTMRTGELVSNARQSIPSQVVVNLLEPIWIYSRQELDGYLLAQATQSGAKLIPSRAVRFEINTSRQWMIEAENGHQEPADLIVGADGATSPARKRFGMRFTSEDLSITAGYYIPGRFHADSIYIRFLEPDVVGYLWSFPRVDHVSLGIIDAYRNHSSAALRQRLSEFARDLYGLDDLERYPNYAAPVPTLREETLKNLKVNGMNWALIGDAAGFVDPITAEGIYYAMRSAELLAEAIEKEDVEDYHRAWREDFGEELAEAARMKERFYQSNLFRESFITRMLQLTQRSPTIHKAQNDLIAGHENYGSLKRKLIRQLPKIIREIL